MKLIPYVPLIMLAGSLGINARGEKPSVPTGAEQIEALVRVKGLFKTPPVKAGSAAHLELADKLFTIAGDEKDSPPGMCFSMSR